MAPNIAKPVNKITNNAIPTTRFLKTAKGRIGSDTRVSYKANIRAMKAPDAKALRTIGSDHAY